MVDWEWRERKAIVDGEWQGNEGNGGWQKKKGNGEVWLVGKGS